MAKKAKSVSKKTKSSGNRPGGNPPMASRFPKGVSGNAKGRPKGSKNLKTIVMEAAGEQVLATIKGKSRRISKLQATVMQLATKASAGDSKSMSGFVKLVDDMETRANATRPAQFPFGEADLKVLHEIYERMKQCSLPTGEA